MITKNDMLLLLMNLDEQGDKKAGEYLEKCVNAVGVDYECLKYINKTRPMEVTQFYERIRKSYNNKKSKLYINIMKETENTTECITTLSAMLTQIFLFSKNLEDKRMFIKHARAEDITRVLNKYAKDFDVVPALQLVHLIKADIKVLESTIRDLA